MLLDEFIYQVRHELGMVPTAEQDAAIGVFARFLTDREARSAMLMCGSAGTGKTTLAAAMVRTLLRLGQRVVLMAPTGRAAKVFSLNSQYPASTIHRQIYRQKTVGELAAQFNLNFNRHSDTLFMVDESSMIPASGEMGRSLFSDLIDYVYSGRNCRLMLIGDTAQLPPVGERESPALLPDRLESQLLKVHACRLDTVLRQSEESGILLNATRIRQLITHEGLTALPKIRFGGFADISRVPGDELIETLSSSYSRVGMDETMVITRSNKRANIYNQGIRNTILDREEVLSRGDWLMIVKNKYLKKELRSERSEGSERSGRSDSSERSDSCEQKDKKEGLDFLANGDRAIVQRVRNIHEMHSFRFADVLLRFPDYDDEELQTTLLLDTLASEAPALTSEQQQQLYESVAADYADLPNKTERLRAMKEDVYLNALQVKYAYAVTCHKAQGGQWAHVYIDQGYMTDDMLSPDYIHWLYTAFTRATEHLYLVNWPATQTEESPQ